MSFKTIPFFYNNTISDSFLQMIELRERLDGISGGMEKMLDASLYTDLDIPVCLNFFLSLLSLYFPS